jgi:hypothetical protein
MVKTISLVAGVSLIALVLWDTFEVMLLPLPIRRSFRVVMLITFFTVGYGDVVPRTVAMKAIAVIEAGCGLGFCHLFLRRERWLQDHAVMY